MTPKEGLECLLKIEANRKENVINKEDRAVVFIVRERGLVVCDTIEKLVKKDFQTPAVLIIPGALHSMEEEALKELQT